MIKVARSEEGCENDSYSFDRWGCKEDDENRCGPNGVPILCGWGGFSSK